MNFFVAFYHSRLFDANNLRNGSLQQISTVKALEFSADMKMKQCEQRQSVGF